MSRWLLASILVAGCASVAPPESPSWHVLVSEVGVTTARLQIFSTNDAVVVTLGEGEAVHESANVWRLRSLRPAASVAYSACDSRSCVEGSFRTAPEPADATAVRFVFGGDVAGQNVCRDQQVGLPMFRVIDAVDPDFFIALGDMVYADNDCEAVGRYGNEQVPLILPGAALSREAFDQRWAYVRSDPDLQALLAQSGYYGVWDDHEVINDFDPDSAGSAFAPGQAAFRHWSGISDGEMYRRFRWGQHVEMFILDTRSYRSTNGQQDGPGKTLLGVAQREWLVDGLRESDATWKFVVSSVPLVIPTGWPPEGPRDGWANAGSETGFENELLGMLDALGCVSGLVWLTTDVHFATAFALQAPAGWSFVELVTGPMHAGLFPSQSADETLQPRRLHFHGPSGVDAVADFHDALQWFNSGLVEIDPDGSFGYRVVTAQDDDAFELSLPVPDSCQSR